MPMSSTRQRAATGGWPAAGRPAVGQPKGGAGHRAPLIPRGRLVARCSAAETLRERPGRSAIVGYAIRATTRTLSAALAHKLSELPGHGYVTRHMDIPLAAVAHQAGACRMGYTATH